MLDTASTQTHIQIQQKILEERILDDVIAVYDTQPFGHLVTINQQVIVAKKDGFFFHEMMAHVPLFAHPLPKKIAVIGNDTGIISEVLKHSTVERVTLAAKDIRTSELLAQYFPDLATVIKHDARVTQAYDAALQWQLDSNLFDVVILSQVNASLLQQLTAIRDSLDIYGSLVMPCPSPLHHQEAVADIHQALTTAGFPEQQLFHFPQPSYPSGWRFALLAYKKRYPRRIREKDIYNRIFRTQYYNFDVHKASLVLPEFLVNAM